MTEDEMVGWHHQFNGREFEQAPRDGDGQGSLVCCRSWGGKESDTTYQLNNKNEMAIISLYLSINCSRNILCFKFNCFSSS